MQSKLKVLGAEHGRSQAGLAKKLKVSRQTLNAIEKKKYAPSISQAVKIGRLLGMPIEDIFIED